jgi:hypothetical protein
MIRPCCPVENSGKLGMCSNTARRRSSWRPDRRRWRCGPDHRETPAGGREVDRGHDEDALARQMASVIWRRNGRCRTGKPGTEQGRGRGKRCETRLRTSVWRHGRMNVPRRWKVAADIRSGATSSSSIHDAGRGRYGTQRERWSAGAERLARFTGWRIKVAELRPSVELGLQGGNRPIL